MDGDIAKVAEQLGKAFEEYKKVNDQQVSELKRGLADVVTSEKLARVDETITKLQDQITTGSNEVKKQIDDLQTAVTRPGLTGEGKGGLSPEAREHIKAFGGYLRKGNDSGLGEIQRKAMSAGSDPDGGYLAPAEQNARIQKRIFDTTPMRQIATVMTISAGEVEFLRDTDEASAEWVSETGTRNTTNTPQVGRIRIPTFIQSAKPKITQQLLDDSQMDVEEWLVNKVSDKFGRNENNAYANGDGITKPKGFVSSAYTAAAVTTDDSTRAWGVLQYVASGASGDFASSNPADKLFDLIGTLKVGYQAGASWMLPRAVVTKIRKFKESTTNAYIWQPGLQAGQPSQLLGFPVYLSEDMPALAANSFSLAFGNFKEGYTIVDRLGINVLRDPYSAKPFIEFYTTKRTGGDVTNFEAIKLMKFA